MAVDVLLGLQWGDEGKGKIVDFLSPKYDVVARFQGGPNAGHTLEFDGIKHVLHQIPSGVFHSHIDNIIGNGVVLCPIVFKKEADSLTKYNIDLSKNLFISKKAQIILPSHRALDRAYEEAKGDKKIGSTLKGIGPTYADKIGRSGLRVGDVVSANFMEKYKELVAKHAQILNFYGKDIKKEIEADEQIFFECIEFFKQFKIIDSEYFINQKIKEGKKILAEGAQGSLLDIDYGTYPYVTSSNTTVAGACTGLGISPAHIGNVYGIFKAYCTRVGGGPFPTELNNEVGQKIRDIGREYGSTTGRPRRCGWIDLPALKYAVMLNGVTEMFMMKTDVLNSFEKLSLGTAYQLKDSTKTEEFPYDLEDIEVPIYTEMAGWNQELRFDQSFEEFPEELKKYIAFIEKYLEVPVSVISVGPDRKETLIREELVSF
jgi:adenylosuccinate synthase